MIWILLACSHPAPADSETGGPTDSVPPDDSGTSTEPPPITLAVVADAERVTEITATVSLLASDAVSLACVADDVLTEVHHAAAEASASPVLVLYGLLPSTGYTCTATTEGGLVATASVVTGAWADAPEVALEGDPTAVQGAYTLFNVGDLCRGDGTNTVWIADPDGNLRWRWRLPDVGVPDIDASWVGDRFFIGGGAGVFNIGNGGEREVDLAGNILYERLDPVSGVDYNHHTERLADGTNLAIVWQRNSGSQGAFVGFGIERVDPTTGAVIFDWNSQTAVDRGQLPEGRNNQDLFHANAVRWVPDDPEGPAYWVSLAQLGNVIRVDPDTGDVTWRMGVGGDWTIEDPSDEVVGDGWFDFQHDISVDMAHDPPLLRMHDNGLAYGRTRALDLALDLEAHVATVDWQWTEPDWYEYPGGDHDRLPGGHRLLTQGHCDCCQTGDRQSTIAELDPDAGEVVWRLRFASSDAWLYRSQRIDGCAIFANERYCPPE